MIVAETRTEKTVFTRPTPAWFTINGHGQREVMQYASVTRDIEVYCITTLGWSR